MEERRIGRKEALCTEQDFLCKDTGPLDQCGLMKQASQLGE